MKFFYAAAAVIAAFLIGEAVSNCSSECLRENNCACASIQSPLPTNVTPQFVTLSLDDAITDPFYRQTILPLLSNRWNPDGTPITATFYTPHQYTNYPDVNELHNNGHDIGLNSVSKNSIDYWRNANTTLIQQEFQENRQILQNFANVPTTDTVGVRIPSMELTGDTAFTAFHNIGILYDGSCVVPSGNPLFPYTLDEPSDQYCVIGTMPERSHPGVWSVPSISCVGQNGLDCAILAGCQIQGTAVEIKDWLFEQFNRLYLGNRAPMTLMISASWFEIVLNSYEGLQLFLDELAGFNDVFLVSHREVINWSVNPVPVPDYTTSYHTHSQSCPSPKNCYLQFEGQERVLPVCDTCPLVYPWLGNPEGGLKQPCRRL